MVSIVMEINVIIFFGIKIYIYTKYYSTLIYVVDSSNIVLLSVYYATLQRTLL